MKARQWAVMVGALSALAWMGSAFADPGMKDGEDFFQDFHSTRSRAEVQADVAGAKAQHEQQLMARQNEGVRSEAGVYGPSGARYSTPDEDSGAAKYNSKQMDRVYKDLYFGD